MSKSYQPTERPVLDAVTALMFEAYNDLSRGRQYIGMAGVPAPLSCNDVRAYIAATGTLLDPQELEAVVLALDDECRNDWAKENAEEKPRK